MFVVTLRTNGRRVGACPPSATLQPLEVLWHEKTRDWNVQWDFMLAVIYLYASWNTCIGHESIESTSIHDSLVCTLCDSEAIWQQRHSMNLCGLHQAAHHPSQPSKPCYCLPSASIRSWSHQLVTSCDDVLLARLKPGSSTVSGFQRISTAGHKLPISVRLSMVVLFKGP